MLTGSGSTWVGRAVQAGSEVQHESLRAPKVRVMGGSAMVTATESRVTTHGVQEAGGIELMEAAVAGQVLGDARRSSSLAQRHAVTRRLVTRLPSSHVGSCALMLGPPSFFFASADPCALSVPRLLPTASLRGAKAHLGGTRGTRSAPSRREVGEKLCS